MIGPDFCRLMARYNLWQNRSLLTAADGLDDVARKADRGAFFGSIAGTLSHLLWADLIWMSRFTDSPAPGGPIAASPGQFPDWQQYQARRRAADTQILIWAGDLSELELSGDLSWFSGALGREVKRPLALCIGHFFNHQTHHRGQVHAMLTAAGVRPGDTDLFLMPDTID